MPTTLEFLVLNDQFRAGDSLDARLESGPVDAQLAVTTTNDRTISFDERRVPPAVIDEDNNCMMENSLEAWI